MYLERQFSVLGRRERGVAVLGFTAACVAAEEDGEDYDADDGCDGDYGRLVDFVMAAMKLVKWRGLDVVVR